MSDKAGNVNGTGAATGGAANPGGGNTTHGGAAGVMKAPGGDGSYIPRKEFESNPQVYFSDLHANEKNNKSNDNK
ncbi:hypothetical protein L6164_026508 [Bauhinia variegata]|uniref:Uncharacterized protein n=1 Tax=Bauhinia variegata TaxID=167791 RepID=A0ACB9LRV6_BAUVA|nr:hypothetical protein L6164_026508 [Bauhinia variegata]